MYKLTDFSLTELRLLNKLIDKEITDISLFDQYLLNMMPEESETRTEVLEHNRQELPELREMNVRILTAIEMVKASESIQSN